VIAPGRARRPGAARGLWEDESAEELEACPFCEGREERTPPETLALGRGGGGADTPGWRVRVVPNLYPALERQEVVIHAPRHVRTLAELSDEEVERVAEAWRARRAAEPAGYLHALLNEGRAAGASLAHSHSQLVWLREPPPEVARERRESCGVCEVLDAGKPVAEADGVVAVAHPAGRLPYELLIAPRAHEGDAFASHLLPAALRRLADAIRRLHALEGPVPLNAWLHDDPHWHVEVLPRLSVLAGLELGAGIYVNALPPEDAARALREALER
jgi:UDPglucose--hexose-1-phosphate uridylyltransferase